MLEVDGVPTKMTKLPLTGNYQHTNDAKHNDEYIVSIQWIVTVDRSDAVWEKGFFARELAVQAPQPLHARRTRPPLGTG